MSVNNSRLRDVTVDKVSLDTDVCSIKYIAEQCCDLHTQVSQESLETCKKYKSELKTEFEQQLSTLSGNLATTIDKAVQTCTTETKSYTDAQIREETKLVDMMDLKHVSNIAQLTNELRTSLEQVILQMTTYTDEKIQREKESLHKLEEKLVSDMAQMKMTLLNSSNAVATQLKSLLDDKMKECNALATSTFKTFESDIRSNVESAIAKGNAYSDKTVADMKSLLSEKMKDMLESAISSASTAVTTKANTYTDTALGDKLAKLESTIDTAFTNLQTSYDKQFVDVFASINTARREIIDSIPDIVNEEKERLQEVITNNLNTTLAEN